MAKNTYRTPKVKAEIRQKRKSRLRMVIDNVIGFDHLFGEGDNAWPIRNIERILWITFLMTIYVGLNHNAERLVRQIQQTKTSVDELRAKYTTLEADFMKSGKQSELSKRVAPLGLTDGQTPPRKIIVKSDE
nr:FtsL-like putative cell division protein [uncultured Arsenicibacter sp.]